MFTNDLAPTQAKAQGCELASRGRLSQAQNTVSQAMAAADSEPRPALAAPGTGPVLTPNLAPALSLPSAMPSTASSTATSTVASSAASTTTLAAPTTTAARKAHEPTVDASRQRQRDSHAREIVWAELARTQARIQALSAQPPAGPEAESALQRLQRDEDALRRELARRPG